MPIPRGILPEKILFGHIIAKEVISMDPSAILSGLPTNFARALADDPAAFQRFLALPPDGKRALIHQTRGALSQEAIQALVTSLHV